MQTTAAAVPVTGHALAICPLTQQTIGARPRLVDPLRVAVRNDRAVRPGDVRPHDTIRPGRSVNRAFGPVRPHNLHRSRASRAPHLPSDAPPQLLPHRRHRRRPLGDTAVGFRRRRLLDVGGSTGRISRLDRCPAPLFEGGARHLEDERIAVGRVILRNGRRRRDKTSTERSGVAPKPDQAAARSAATSHAYAAVDDREPENDG